MGDANLDRRGFLTFLLAGPVLTVGAQWAAAPAPAGAAPTVAGAAPRAQVPSLPDVAEVLDIGDILILVGLPTALILVIEVAPDGTIHFELPRAEVGQGIVTATTMIVAEELDVPVGQVRTRLAPAKPELLFNQFTATSNSIRSIYHPLRKVAAVVRARLVAAAAAQWGLAPAALRTAGGAVFAPDGRSTGYGALSAAAANPALGDITAEPKPAHAHTVVGTPTRRTDAHAIVTGALRYTMDLQVPGALPTMVRRAPTINGFPLAYDDTEARKLPGVVATAMVPTGVAVAAETFGQALAATRALKVQWGPGTVDGMSDAQFRDRLRGAIPGWDEPPATPDVLDADYEYPFVPHAPLETNCAIADVRPDGADIWSALQSPVLAQESIALELLLPLDRVRVHVMQAGGSFGRRLFHDGALEAARVSRAMGRPVKLMWSRVDDMRHGRARPASHHRLRARFAGGNVVALQQRAAYIETDFRYGLGEILSAAVTHVPVIGNQAFAQTQFRTSVSSPYNLGLVTHELFEVPMAMHTGAWRSVYSAGTRGSEEMFVDEIAAKLGRDPVEFRRAHLAHPRVRAVLDKVVEAGRWGRALPPGHGQGVSLQEEYKSAAACLVEIDARDTTNPRVTKAVIAVDVGKCVNPLGVQAQMLGGLTDAIATILRAGLHIVDGLPLEGSYSQFHYARQRNSPPDTQVHILHGAEEPGGVGELGVTTAVGAIANAYARATGTRPRRFPINNDVDFEPFPR